MLSDPFKLSLTELITNVDINGTAPLSGILETVILEEFIIDLGIAIVVDEMDISGTGSIIPINVILHRKVLSVELYITCSLSPVWLTVALGEGDILTAPIILHTHWLYSLPV